jgi:Tol biopolymer transport system component
MRTASVLSLSATTVACALVALVLPAHSRATPSIANGRIALSASVDGASQVFTVKPSGTQLRQVTSRPRTVAAGGVSWSPNGRGLLYNAFEGGGGDQLFKSLADGSGATDINPPCTGTCLGDDNPVYSPDGKKIAFERAFGPIVNGNASVVAIFTMNVDGSHLTQLTQKSRPTSSEDHLPQWSPDGNKIAFFRINTSASPSNESAIEIMNADGNNVRRLTPWRIEAADPHWSPSGKQILFDTFQEPLPGKSANLFTMRADGTHRVPLTHYSGGTLQAFADAWSPDGTQILFHRMKYSGTDTEVGGYYILHLGTNNIRRLTHIRIHHDANAAWGRKPG